MSDGPEGCYVKVNDLTVYYEESGIGEPLILLHGGGLTSEIWKPQRSILSKHFQVFPPDCRGHGCTNNPLGTLSYRVLADDLDGFIKKLNLVKTVYLWLEHGREYSIGVRNEISRET